MGSTMDSTVSDTRQHFAGFPAQCVGKGRLKVAKTAGVTARGGVGVGVGGKG